jgi:DnaK suppressor protein
MQTTTETVSKTRSKQLGGVEKLLKSKRDHLRRQLNTHLGNVSVDVEPDDEGALATSNFARDLAVATLERERRELKEIEAALARIKAGEYGLCQSCGSPIREIRLQALPWARLCIKCADRNQQQFANGD